MTSDSLVGGALTFLRESFTENLGLKALSLTFALGSALAAAGGIGYVSKPRLASDLMVAVREARAGRPFVSETAPRRPA